MDQLNRAMVLVKTYGLTQENYVYIDKTSSVEPCQAQRLVVIIIIKTAQCISVREIRFSNKRSGQGVWDAPNNSHDLS